VQASLSGAGAIEIEVLAKQPNDVIERQYGGGKYADFGRLVVVARLPE
jgi:hypothetical protein